MAATQATRTEASALDVVELFEGLDPEALRRLDKRCRWHRYAANETILDRESTNRDVFFVVEGTVRVVNFSPSGREIAFANIHRGGHFGELAAIDEAPRSATVVAVEDCRLASLGPEPFRRLMLDNPELALRVMTRLAAIVRRCDDRIMDLSTLGAVHRVQAELLRLATPDIVAPGNWVIRPMRTHTVIASRVSTTRETVARVLSQLAVAGIVERKGKTLYIRDHERLSNLIESGAVLQGMAGR